MDFPEAPAPGRMPSGTAGTGCSPLTADSPGLVRQLLRAGETLVLLPDKQPITCPCCGQAMTFFHALRTRARPPPEKTPFAITV